MELYLVCSIWLVRKRLSLISGIGLIILLAGCTPTAELCEDYYSNGYDEGKQAGYQEGYDEGHDEGYDEAYGAVEDICGGYATCADYY